MVKMNHGKLIATGLKFGVVVGRFNEFISGKLLDGVIDGTCKAWCWRSQTLKFSGCREPLKSH